jgi:putative nucleotidyltransferase with HDIG domain
MSKRAALQRLGDRVTLPSLPEAVVQIDQMMDDRSSGLYEMGSVVAQDRALTATILRIANSSFCGLSEPLFTPQEAATVVGAHSLRNLVLQASIMKRYERYAKLPDFDLEELWTHSLFTAQLSRALAGRAEPVDGASPEDFYTCGLLHDVGKVLLIEGLGDEYLEVIRHARRVGRALHVVEKQQLGFAHVEVGALLAQRWELPQAIATAIEFHHGPREAILSERGVAILSIADQIAYRARSRTFEATAGRLAALAGKVLGIEPAGFDEVLELARGRAETFQAW